MKQKTDKWGTPPAVYQEYQEAVRELNAVETEIVAATQSAQAPLKDRHAAAQQRYAAAITAMNKAVLEQQ